MKDKKDKWVMVRLSEKELEKAKEMAKKAGLPISTYFRTKTLYGGVR